MSKIFIGRNEEYIDGADRVRRFLFGSPSSFVVLLFDNLSELSHAKVTP